MNKTILPLIILAAILSGCQNYVKRPIDWEAEFTQASTNAIHLTKPEDASLLALIGNRQINVQRLKASTSANIAHQSGWWEDPEFDFDIMRIINPGDNPFLGGASIAFTIPLSGALKREKAALLNYAQADTYDIKAAERDLSVTAANMAIRLAALRERSRKLKAFENDKRIIEAQNNVTKLHIAGEVSATERARIRRAIHAREHAAIETDRQISRVQNELIHLLGLNPAVKIETDFTSASLPTNAPSKIDVRELIKHPRVKAALARLQATEESLDAEIRKQYPDLKLGPAYANEEGLDRLGIVAGITLPLWNRNRKGIAQAQGERDEKRLSAINEWHTLVCSAASAADELAVILSHPPQPPTAIEDAERLAAAGELTPLEYLDVRAEILENEFAEDDWHVDVAIAINNQKLFEKDEQ